MKCSLHPTSLLACLATASLIAPASSQAQIEHLGGDPGGSSRNTTVSADGSTIVFNHDAGTRYGYRWTALDGAQRLPAPANRPSQALALSHDGSRVVGRVSPTDAAVAALWGPDGTLTLLGPVGGPVSTATRISGDGSTVGGYVLTPTEERRAFIWTSAGSIDLGTLGGESSRITGLSFDGQVAVGSSTNASGVLRAFRWTPATGMLDLGTAPGQSSEALHVSSSGDVISGMVSETGLSADMEVFRWTATSGFENLGTAGGLRTRSVTMSADGSTLTGSEFKPDGIFTQAFLWTEATGMTTPFPVGDMYPRAISADGSTIAGRMPTGVGVQLQAFRWRPQSGLEVLGQLSDLTAHQALSISADGRVIVGLSDEETTFERAVSWRESGAVGGVFCDPAVPNSTGSPGNLRLVGNNLIASPGATLEASQLPLGVFGIFLASPARDLIFPVTGSQGLLCLGTPVGRYLGPGQIQDTGTTGTMSLSVDPMALASPTGPVAAEFGDSWNFQAWYRDSNPGGTSNFTSAVSVRFY